jgi:hypothetical protein
MEIRAKRLNMLVDLGSAAVLAAALGTAVYWIFSGLRFESGTTEASVSVALFSFLLTFEGMRRIDRTGDWLTLSAFVPAPIVAEEPDELVLTDIYRSVGANADAGELMLTEVYRPADPIRETGELLLSHVYRQGSEQDELLLDDILREIGPESRVVRLFDPSRMPTAGELQENIERHLSAAGRAAPEQNAYPDDSQALHDALAELKRSLR